MEIEYTLIEREDTLKQITDLNEGILFGFKDHSYSLADIAVMERMKNVLVEALVTKIMEEQK